jgi:hypothetical protein
MPEKGIKDASEIWSRRLLKISTGDGKTGLPLM